MQPTHDALKERAAQALEEWGVPSSYTDSDITDAQTLSKILAIAESRIPSMGCRVFPSSFDANDPLLRAFPRPIGWRWVSCERALRFYGARVVMTRLPHFWQLESPVHAVCRNIGAPIFTNEIENIPVGAAAIMSADVNAVLSESTSSFAFISYLAERKIALPRIWMLIHSANTPQWDIPALLEHEALNVVQEVHIFPGVPVLEQCTHLSQEKKPLFHVSDAYRLEQTGDRATITSTGDDPLPLWKLALPFRIQEISVCLCGKKVFSRGKL